LGGHPLIGWSVRAAARSNRIDRVVVSTDSAVYAEIGKSYGAEVPFLRPPELASDLSPDLGFLQHAIGWFSEHHDRVPDFWVHLRPTTPLRDVAVIDSAISSILNDEDASALRSVHEMSESAYKAFELDGGRLKQVGTGSTALDSANAARQSFAKTFFANGYVDVIRTRLIREHGQMHGDRVRGFVTPAVIEIDTLEDFEHLEFQVARRPEVSAHLFG